MMTIKVNKRLHKTNFSINFLLMPNFDLPFNGSQYELKKTKILILIQQIKITITFRIHA